MKTKKHVILMVLAPVALSGFIAVQNVDLKKSFPGPAGCSSTSSRPCYDKQTGRKLLVMRSKGGENAFVACMNNRASKHTSELSASTPICTKEIYKACYDGSSHVLVRKFDGACELPSVSLPPPPATSEDACSTFRETQQFYFDICAVNGYDNVCFNKSTGEYQGCTMDSRDECTVYNVNADKNVLCEA